VLPSPGRPPKPGREGVRHGGEPDVLDRLEVCPRFAVLGRIMIRTDEEMQMILVDKRLAKTSAPARGKKRGDFYLKW